MTDKARELLERAIEVLDFDRGLDADDLMEEIRAYLAEPEQDEGPVAWMFFSSKGRPHYHLNEYQALEGLKMYGGSKVIALYEHPAPRKPFVRLSEEECISIHRKWVDSGRSISRFARAIEDALEEKNK